jgi:hypothetical protein
MGDSRRKFNEDSVSERRDERVESMSAREVEFDGGGRGTLEGEGAGSGGGLAFFVF